MRSPVSYLNLIVEKSLGLSDYERASLKKSVERINGVAESLLGRTRPSGAYKDFNNLQERQVQVAKTDNQSCVSGPNKNPKSTECFCLKDIVEDTLEEYSGLYPGIRFSLDIDSEYILAGSSMDTFRALSNLLKNSAEAIEDSNYPLEIGSLEMIQNVTRR